MRASVPQEGATEAGSALQVGWRDSGSLEGSFVTFPQHPSAELCAFFVSTGHCKYGDACFKHHPVERGVKRNLKGFPLRPGRDACSFYMTTGTCKFGGSCKFHHPNLAPLYAGANLEDACESPAADSMMGVAE